MGLARKAAGFGPAFRTSGSVAAGAVIGFALYVIQGAPTLEPIILLNAFAQVFVVSVSEILVCWAVIAATVENRLEGYGKILAGLAGAVTASVLSASTTTLIVLRSIRSPWLRRSWSLVS